MHAKKEGATACALAMRADRSIQEIDTVDDGSRGIGLDSIYLRLVTGAPTLAPCLPPRDHCLNRHRVSLIGAKWNSMSLQAEFSKSRQLLRGRQ